jgi:exonuclease III
MLWNANKIENKIDEVYLSLDTNNIDILAINETKLDSVGENFI